MIRGIGHIAYVVKDMEKSMHFYCDILGFQKAFDLKDNQGNPWIEYLKIRDGQFIELFYGKDKQMQAEPKALSYSHLCLEVEDIFRIANHLKDNGVSLDVEPKQGADLNYQCWAKDPDGNRIEFMQMNPQSPQMKR